VLHRQRRRIGRVVKQLPASASDRDGLAAHAARLCPVEGKIRRGAAPVCPCSADRRQAGQRVHDHAFAGDGHFIVCRLAENLRRYHAMIGRQIGMAQPDIRIGRFAEGDNPRRAVLRG
jgi:hypothetical protein